MLMSLRGFLFRGWGYHSSNITCSPRFGAELCHTFSRVLELLGIIYFKKKKTVFIWLSRKGDLRGDGCLLMRALDCKPETVEG